MTYYRIFEVIEDREFDGRRVINRYDDRLEAYMEAVLYIKDSKYYGDISVEEALVKKKELRTCQE